MKSQNLFNLFWITGNMLALACGFALVTYWVGDILTLIDLRKISVYQLVSLIITGGCLGIVQSSILKLGFRKGILWILSTALSFGIGFQVFLFVGIFLAGLIGFFLALTVIGFVLVGLLAIVAGSFICGGTTYIVATAQLFVIKSEIPDFWLWQRNSAFAGVASGIVMGTLPISFTVPGIQGGLLTGVVFGLIYGLITAKTARKLLVYNNSTMNSESQFDN